MKFLPAIFLSLLFFSCSDSSESTPPPYQQALIVLTQNWDSLQAVMTAVEWTEEGWKTVGTHLAVVGNNGLGWGLGVKDFTDRKGPVKEEGDKKSPAGVFTIGTAFGKAHAEALPSLHLPYQQIIYELQCIEDRDSEYYNQLVMENDPAKDWVQNDRMLREDDLYDLGAFVNHNMDPAIPGSGSCIFLHLWRNPGSGTLGCTAMDRQELLQHLTWLDPRKSPVLVQVPESAYPDLAKEFGLPEVF